jgi:hypothetical protein
MTAALRRALAALTILFVLNAFGSAAQAQTRADSVGTVSSVKAPATVTRGGAARAVKTGDDIFQNDELSTGIGGALGVTFDDETTFTLQANTSITVNEFVYSKGGGGNKALVGVVRGTTAFFASQVAKTGDMKITTPTATLGIRGTSGVIEVPDGSRPGGQVQVKLYQDASGATGRIELFDRAGTQRLGELTQAATGFAIAREGARFAAVALTISAQQIALDRGLVGRVFSLQRGAGAKLLNQRILRIPDLQRRLNLQNIQRLNLPQQLPQQQLQRQLQQQPRLQRPSIQTGPSGPGSIPMPRLPSIPNIGR